MTVINTTVSAFEKLYLETIPADWIKATVECDYTEVRSLVEDDFANVIRDHNFFAKELEKLKEAIACWWQEEQDGEEGLWTVLVENDIYHKSVVCLLALLMEAPQKRAPDCVELIAAIEAANVYMSFLMVPGSSAYKLFHPELFQKAMSCFKLYQKIYFAPKGKRKRSGDLISGSQSSQSSQAGRGKKRRRPQVVEEEDEDMEQDGEETSALSNQDLLKLSNKLFTLLKTLVVLLERYSLCQAEEAVFTVLQTLADLSRLEPETFSGQFANNPVVARMLSTPELCFHGLQLLCTKAHGDVPTVTCHVLKALLPSLLMLIGENQAAAAQSIPRNTRLIKDHALHFVCYLLKSEREGSFAAVRILIQQMCSKVTDRVEYRSAVAEAVIVLLQALPAQHYARCIEWVFKLGRSNKLSWRVFALEVACLLLDENERPDVAASEHESAVCATHAFLLQMLVARCSDSAPTVRARALTGFANCLTSQRAHITRAVYEMLTPATTTTGAPARQPITRIVQTPDADRPRVERPDSTGDCHMTTEPSLSVAMETGPALGEPGQQQGEEREGSRRARTSIEMALASLHLRPRDSPFMTVQLTPGVEITLTDGQGVASMLRRRVRDEKVNVRKAALHALEALIRLNKTQVNAKDVEMISDSCRDPSLLVRKQALVSLTDLLHHIPANATVQTMFLTGVLPLVLDREVTAQEKCVAICTEVFLTNITAYNRSTEERHKILWDLCSIIAGNNGVEFRRYLSKCCELWHKAGHFSKQLIAALKTHVGTEHNQGAWMLLSEITEYFRKVDADFVIEYWNTEARHLSADKFSVVQEVLRVLGHVAKCVRTELISDVTADLKVRLMQFNLPPVLISTTVTALSELVTALTGDSGTADAMTKQWFIDLLNASDQYLSAIILNEYPEEAIDEEKIVCHLFTLGEIAPLCPDKTPKRLFLLIQSLVSTPVITSLDGSSQGGDSQSDSQTSTNQNAETEGIGLSQGSQGSQFSQGAVLSQFRGSKMPPKVRAYAFITLGKLSLQHEGIAKKCVAALARELETCSDPVVRNNVVITMCDLCIRYTQLVDSYVGRISACLKDDSPLIRKQTLHLLTHLLQEDYIKWKDSLFYRFAMSLIDEEQEIRDFGEFCMVYLLTQRHPGMFYQHFVECVYHFNNYNGHKVYNKFPQTEKEKEIFSLKGQANYKKRERIYTFLLSHMNDEHKFQLSGKLCHDVLGSVVDGVMPFDADSAAIVQDTLRILCYKEIKLSSLRAKTGGDDAETELEMAQVVMQEARKKVISQVVKMNVIENIVPTVIGLKHILETNRSEVLRDLMLYLRELMKDYKNELQDILSADRQLATEIEFDLRKFEEREAEAREAAEARRNLQTPQPAAPLGLHSPRLNTNRSVAPGAPLGVQSPRLGTSRTLAPGQPLVHSPRLDASTTVAPAPATPARALSGVASPPASSPHTAADGTPQRPAPADRLLSPGNTANPPRTPARDLSLCTKALLNSARKVMAQITPGRATPGYGTPGLATAARSSPGRINSRATPVQSLYATQQTAGGQKKVAFSASVDARDTSQTLRRSIASNLQSPHPTTQARAISTPTANLTLSNITFMDPNASIIPPSPIASERSADFTSRLPGSPQWIRQRVVDPITRVVQETDVLCMTSPDKPAPKPRVWKISVREEPEKACGEKYAENANQDTLVEDQSSRSAATSRGKKCKTRNASENREDNQQQPGGDKSETESETVRRRKTTAKPLEEINNARGADASASSCKTNKSALSEVSMDV